MTDRGETIAAVATPPGRGAIAILRLSGPAVRAIARGVGASAALRAPRRAMRAEILDARGCALDSGVAIFFPAPRSYTAQDVLELHVHANPLVVRETLEALLAAGARLAKPGEFTRRAYEAGKIDLSEAAAVADLIAAESRAAAQAALANLGGALHREIARIRGALMTQLENLAGAIDFPDEVPDPDAVELTGAIEEIERALLALRDGSAAGAAMREGLAIAIVGPPNAGKSSLLNALLGWERALVSSVAGTTRDTIEESLSIDGVQVRLTDTAGIRAHADALEAAGIERTMRALENAQIALVVIDGSKRIAAPERAVLDATRERGRIVLCNKSDLGDIASDDPACAGAIVGSANDPATIGLIRTAIANAGWHGERFDLSRPHLAHAFEIDAVEEALRALGHVRATLGAGEPIDLCSADLQRAAAALGHVTGEAAGEEIVDAIFARFCIGK
ncbi:MAG: tRNA uridine-5-carboxymethylaminomethyl(34) synthesis GTPase MnmE [Candidatus Tyrphobacter sp.]